ncbi:hypothetical protein BGZ79_002296 [Entomortierella chlamydospora]|nr:hypothetical protein BGZ79_002296 [Entomortierella chlamydospora]
MIIGKPEEDELEILPALGSKEGCVPTAVEDEEGVEKIIDDELEIPVVGKGLEVKMDEEDMGNEKRWFLKVYDDLTLIWSDEGVYGI